jgi:hypothetical protein
MKKVYFWHMKALGYCNRRMRPWFAGRGIDWQTVLDDGVDADLLLASGDAQAIAAVRYAEATGWSATPLSADRVAKRGGCV